ncbi:c-type cytochrome [Legionella brunensis]|uniref:Putative Cytochrome c, class I n=1 Tax=Legionella brunensis TaxID=29422 RepID=A0A0W0ST37_9GAMM|nr:c-type cytochrome [Legionella brunensis]KTC86567.1 putative Cytochrome c, class I precursor [Legionella brunensis]
MKIVWVILLCVVSTVVSADDLGRTTYEIACQNCHAPKLAKAIKAPAAFDKKAWNIRFKHASIEAKRHPARFKTAIDYLLYSVKLGKGLMHHGGLCNEASIPDKNCSDEALIQAIHYMAQN